MATTDVPERQAVAAPAVIAPGNYDGVHLGHRALIARARELAKPGGLRVVPLTFDPHPTAVLAPERAPLQLTTMARRCELLRGVGADDVWVQAFSRQYAAQSPAEFAQRLAARGGQAVVVGPDFRFGHRRAGDVEQLRELGNQLGFRVHVESPVLLDGERVSSSAIRGALLHGEVEQAARMLSRAHELCGEVVQGDRRGRTLGFPTANLTRVEGLVPADGVYAVWARELGRAPGKLLSGVANLGTRPTFEAGRSIEVHLFDYAGDLYGKALRVGFAARIRGEQSFDGAAALKRQIEVDCAQARGLLADVEPGWSSWI